MSRSGIRTKKGATDPIRLYLNPDGKAGWGER